MLTDYETSKMLNRSYYIIGVFDNLPPQFTIGDNITYNGSYKNTPLKHDLIKTATVHIGYVFDIKQV